MPFIGFLEIAAIALCGIVSLVAYFGIGLRRWCTALLICVTLAALLTPSDIYSTVLLAIVLFAGYGAGTFHRSITPPSTT